LSRNFDKKLPLLAALKPRIEQFSPSEHGHPDFLSLLTIYMLNLLKPTGYVMHQQFKIQQMYALPTLYLCVLYLSEGKQRLVPITA